MERELIEAAWAIKKNCEEHLDCTLCLFGCYDGTKCKLLDFGVSPSFLDLPEVQDDE